MHREQLISGFLVVIDEVLSDLPTTINISALGDEKYKKIPCLVIQTAMSAGDEKLVKISDGGMLSCLIAQHFPPVLRKCPSNLRIGPAPFFLPVLTRPHQPNFLFDLYSMFLIPFQFKLPWQRWQSRQPQSRGFFEWVPEPPWLHVLAGFPADQLNCMAMHDGILNRPAWNMFCSIKQPEELRALPHFLPAVFIPAIVHAPFSLYPPVQVLGPGVRQVPARRVSDQ